MGFEKIGQEILIKGRVFDLERLRVRLPNQQESTYEMISHPGAVAIIALDAEERILFVRQFRPASWMEVLELPAGTLERGEDVLECAKRELREETGWAAREMRELGAFYLAPGYSSEYLHMFLARDLYYAPLEADQDEFIHVEAVPVSQAYEMAHSGVFKDGKTLAGLLLAEPHITQNK
ncbi:MAG: NUDIX hydrolase [Anaerolineae bacterium]|nr:NUDIX hydrolase [Anaerolineae bacterium]